MKRLRRPLLELWAILLLAGVIGFLGPFGTFLMGDFLSRASDWWFLIMGAYILTRPVFFLSHRVARATGLPQGVLVFSSIVVSSVPVAIIWHASAPDQMSQLSGYSGLVPFSLLCSLAVFAVVWWAERADAHLAYHYRNQGAPGPDGRTMALPPAPIGNSDPSTAQSLEKRPDIYDQLSPRFQGEILALEGEDHYVRVHGMQHSELLFMRLRDAIMAMGDCPGEQTHRSWWVARSAMVETVANGRKREIRLKNGLSAPIARDSIDSLERSGFLPSRALND